MKITGVLIAVNNLCNFCLSGNRIVECVRPGFQVIRGIHFQKCSEKEVRRGTRVSVIGGCSVFLGFRFSRGCCH